MKSFDLYIGLVERRVGRLEDQTPRQLSGMETIRALWPLNLVFLPRLVAIRSLPYLKRFEGEADAAIEAAVRKGVWPPVWEQISDGAWRVMLERYLQGLRAALNNEKNGSSVMAVPEKLAGHDVTFAVMIYVMHGMKLPWPAMDRSAFELTTEEKPENLRLH